MAYKKGLIEIVEEIGEGRCSACNRPIRDINRVLRNGREVGRYGSTCVTKIIEANEKNRVDLVLEGLSFTELFQRPDVRDVRGFNRVNFDGTRRTQLLENVIRLNDGEYLRVPEDVEIVPDIENFRKKGYFINLNQTRSGRRIIPKSKEEIEEKQRTPARAAYLRLKEHDFWAYAGMVYWGLANQTRRVWSLDAIANGKMVYLATKREDNDAKISLVSNQGTAKIFLVPSDEEEGVEYKVKLEGISIEQTNRYSRSFEFTYQCDCWDAIYNNLPHRDLNIPNGSYANKPIRPCKHANAAIYHMMEVC